MPHIHSTKHKKGGHADCTAMSAKCACACPPVLIVRGVEADVFLLSAFSLRRSVFPSLANFLLVLCGTRTVSTCLIAFLFGLGPQLVGVVVSAFLCASEVYAVHYGIGYFVVCSHLSDVFCLY